MAAQTGLSALSQTTLSYLLDTNVVIGLLSNQTASLELLKAANTHLAEMAVSQITRLELLGFAGMTEQETRGIENFLNAIQVLGISPKVEAQTIALRQQRKIKLPDAIVIATAQAHRLKLLTLDKRLSRVS